MVRPRQFLNTEKLPAQEGSRADPIAFHNQISSTWEANYQSTAFVSRKEAFEAALRGRNVRGMLWLDAGCGSGTLTRWLAKCGAEVIGVDGAPEMVRVAREVARTTEYDHQPKFHVANVGALPFSDCSFDGVLCSSVLEYVERPDVCLNEIARVMKPGGVLLISVPNSESVMRIGLRILFFVTKMMGVPRPRYMGLSRHQYSTREFWTLLRRHDYEPDCAIPFGSSLPSWLRQRRWIGRLLLFRADKR